jgi:hypothetical protein
LTISWATSATGFALKSKNSLTDATRALLETQYPTTGAAGSGRKFYRLRK